MPNRLNISIVAGYRFITSFTDNSWSMLNV